MVIFLGLLVGIIYVFFIVPSQMDSKIFPLQRDISILRQKIADLERRLGLTKDSANDSANVLEETPIEEKPTSAASPASAEQYLTEDVDHWADDGELSEKQNSYIPKIKDTKPIESSSELNLGTKLPVWIGSISLIFAAVFLVKYSIDAGWFGPTVRVIMNLIFGIGLIIGGLYITAKKSIPNFERVAQGLVGAGIVALYAGLYSAVNIHDMISPSVGFVGMALVTIVAIILSIKQGQVIAIFGLIGGMLTPALVATDTPNPTGLFSYLFVLTGGLIFTMISRNWWGLSILTALGAFAWTILWIFSGSAEGSETTVSLFSVGLLGSILFATARVMMDEQERSHANTLNLIAIAGTSIIFLLLQSQLSIGFFELSMIGLMGIATLILAYLRPNIYRWAVAGKCVLDAIILTIWVQDASLQDGLIALCGFFTIYAVFPQIVMNKSHDPRPWAVLQCAASLIAFLIGFTWLDIPQYYSDSKIWGLVAIFFAILSAYQASVWKDSNIMLASYAASCTAFLSLGFAIELDSGWYPIAFAMQTLALVWIGYKSGLPVLIKLAKILAGVFIFSVSQQILLFVDHIFMSIIKSHAQFFDSFELTNPLPQLGIPALVFSGLTYFVARTRPLLNIQKSQIILIFGTIALGLIFMTAYYLVRGLYHTEEHIFDEVAGFIERGNITLLFLLMAVVFYKLEQKYQCDKLADVSKIFLFVAIARLVYFDLIICNPFFDRKQEVGDLKLLNGVTLVYGAGIVASIVAIRYHPYFKILAAIFLFAFISLTIRQFFNGNILDNGMQISRPEFYTYSIVWLITGLILLGLGIHRNDRSIRAVALGFLVLTIGKVFLFDASVLEGLMRVFSFLGLGISLIGLSVFYTKFINKNINKG